MNLKDKDAALHDRLNLLMDKFTNDLDVDSSLYETSLKAQGVIDKFHSLINSYISKSVSIEDTLHCLGMRNVNGYDLSTVKGLQGAALYPTYPLINSHCYSNTRYLKNHNLLSMKECRIIR